MMLLVAVSATGVSSFHFAHAVKVINTDGATIEMDAGKGRLIRLNGVASTVFVAEPEIADIQVKSPRLVYVFAKKPGETSLYAVDANDRVLVNAHIRVSHNLGRLRKTLRTLMPESEITVRSIDGAVVLSGEVRTASESEEARRIAVRFSPEEGGVINQLGVTAPNQVSLRVRIAEVSREVTKELGFNWESTFSKGDWGGVLGTGRDVIPDDSSSFLRSTQDALGITLFRSGINLNVLIDALENQGLVSILAEPNLTAVSGETASFLAGGEFPIPVAQEDNKVTIEFKKFGVSLAFTPTLINGSRISMRVRPEVSQLTTTGSIQVNNFNIPALSTRRAETTVELGSGQAFAIGGLLQDNINHEVRRFPGLGSVPILGSLFRSDSFQRNETELVIIVTPFLVQPTEPTRLAAPTDGLVMPDDTERVLKGMTHRPSLPQGQPVPDGPEGRRLHGPAGFELE
jgi:pilus assembly protein CpaC